MRIRHTIGSLLGKFSVFKSKANTPLDLNEASIKVALNNLERSFNCWFNPERFLQAITLLEEQKNNSEALKKILANLSQKRLLKIHNSLCRKEVGHVLTGLSFYGNNLKDCEFNDPDNSEIIKQKFTLTNVLTAKIIHLRATIFNTLDSNSIKKAKKNLAKPSGEKCKPEALKAIQTFIASQHQRFTDAVTATVETHYQHYTLG